MSLGLLVALGGASPTRAATPGNAGVSLGGYLDALAEGAAALAAGDAVRAELAARSALALSVSDRASARAYLTLGLALRVSGRYGEAAAALARAIPHLEDGTLEAEARFERGESLFYAGHPGAAASLFAEVAAADAGALSRRARWREADALLEAGAPNEAALAYRRLLAEEPASPAAPGARLGLARAQRAAGELVQAVASYRALWIEQPADPAGRAAGRALRLWRAQGGPVPPATPEERFDRAVRLFELALPRRVTKALDRLDALAPEKDLAARSALLRALALWQVGERDRAQLLARQLAEDPSSSPGVRAGAELVLARAAARAGRLAEAAQRYRALAAERVDIPGLSPAASREVPEDAAYLAAWLYYDAGLYARAAVLLRDYARKHPHARHLDDARWFEAWSLFRAGRKEAARRALARLESTPLGTAALYWEARLSRGEQARALYRKVAREAPWGSWYALLAAGRLESEHEAAPPTAFPASAPIPDGPGSGPAGLALERAAHLLGAGLAGQAVAELRSLAASGEAKSSAAAVAELAEAAGDFELPYRMAREHLGPSRRATRWSYPRAFPDLSAAAALSAHLDVNLYLAVMRRESAFRPDARSGAGAVGLLQLIPPTAERLAALHGVEADLVRELDRAEVGLSLGAAYLALLSDRFAEAAVVLAAYNGGPTPAATWARERAGLPLDEWVEDVPFRETRHYIKNVAADAAVYGALWEGRPLALDGERKIPKPGEGVTF